MFADGDFVTGLQHFFEVAVDGVVRDAGEGDGVFALASAGESDAADAGAGFCVFVEGFVEVTHSEEEDSVRVFLFKAVELSHCGGQFFVLRGHRGRLYTKRSV